MKTLSISVADEPTTRVGFLNIRNKKKQEVITSISFEVTLFAFEFSKSVLESPHPLICKHYQDTNV